MLIVGDKDKHIKLYKHGPDMEKIIQSSLKCTTKELTSIDWQGLKIAMTKLNILEQGRKVRLIQQLWPTKNVLKKQVEGRNKRCAR